MRTRSTAISVGCNAVTNAVAWSPDGLLAFGANRTIAIYDPSSSFGVHATLIGHTSRVTVVRWFNAHTILSGSSDSTVRIWRTQEDGDWTCVQTIQDHTRSISSIAVCDRYFVSTSMDGTFNIYSCSGTNEAQSLQSVSYKPSIPLSVAMAKLPGSESYVLAIGGTSSIICLYGSVDSEANSGGLQVELKAKLPGHEDWIRSFDFVAENETLLLASASQDRYIRLWRIDKRQVREQEQSVDGLMANLILLENKAHDFSVPEGAWKASFEALLVSHEDWVFSVDFSHDQAGNLVLLSSSADSSIIVWNPDLDSQIWTVQAQLGVISTKGASTATGSTGGFWGAIFSPRQVIKPTICAWNKTGSIRLWQKEAETGEWRNIGGVGGHVKEVRSLSWAPGGEYFLTTSLDQSTRLWAKHTDHTWKEFARPQIHGYDIQSIHVMSPTLFISGAEEKIVRVFQATSSVVDLLARIAGIDFRNESTAQAANVPALGLSNKALTSTDQGTHLDRADLEESIEKDNTPISKTMLDTLQTPPTEDHLQRHTLFPELEKLYGHGYEIQALTSTHDGAYILSGCRATTPDHAVLRLYDAIKYKEVAVLPGHSLTVTKAKFSFDDKYLVSVSRDRAICVYKQISPNGGEGRSWKLLKKISKAHKRIIWDCAWLDSTTFATASRDASISLWSIVQGEEASAESEEVTKLTTVEVPGPATSLTFSPPWYNQRRQSHQSVILVVGLESGELVYFDYQPPASSTQAKKDESEEEEEVKKSRLTLKKKKIEKVSDGAITGLAFRPRMSNQSQDRVDNEDEEEAEAEEERTGKELALELAVCSEDCSVRVFQVSHD